MLIWLNTGNGSFWLNLLKQKMLIWLLGWKVTNAFLSGIHTAKLMKMTLGAPGLGQNQAARALLAQASRGGTRPAKAESMWCTD